MKRYINCICPTFGRAPHYAHLLNESTYWFLRQSYPYKRLIILNDAPQQTLRMDYTYPEITIVNASERYPTLGAKLNALIDLCDGDIICPWDDDDISLPHRLDQAAKKFSDGIEYFNPQRTWFENSAGIHWKHSHGYCHNASAFKNGAARYDASPEATGENDKRIDAILQKAVKAIPLTHPRDWSYIYRWGVSDLHLSAHRNMQEVYEHVALKIAPGEFVISPMKGKDYASDCATLASTVAG